jgi:hypothetical protein
MGNTKTKQKFLTCKESPSRVGETRLSICCLVFVLTLDQSKISVSLLHLLKFSIIYFFFMIGKSYHQIKDFDKVQNEEHTKLFFFKKVWESEKIILNINHGNLSCKETLLQKMKKLSTDFPLQNFFDVPCLLSEIVDSYFSFLFQKFRLTNKEEIFLVSSEFFSHYKSLNPLRKRRIFYLGTLYYNLLIPCCTSEYDWVLFYVDLKRQTIYSYIFKEPEEKECENKKIKCENEMNLIARFFAFKRCYYERISVPQVNHTKETAVMVCEYARLFCTNKDHLFILPRMSTSNQHRIQEELLSLRVKRTRELF